MCLVASTSYRGYEELNKEKVRAFKDFSSNLLNENTLSARRTAS